VVGILTLAVPCLDDHTALAFAQGRLHSRSGAEALAEIDEVIEHIDRCSDCRRLVALAASGDGGASADAGEPPELPASVGRFAIDGIAGVGAMGIVYRGRDERLDRAVAVKVIRPERLAPDTQGRFEREARALAKVDHPGVVRVYEVGDVDGAMFLAMEYVVGGTLRQWLDDGPHPESEIVARFRQAGAGLLAAHQAGLVHRDFKPANVMIGARGRVCVTDFGLVGDGAAQAELPPSGTWSLALTQTGAVLGTPAYMAPEQLEGGRTDPRSDQFSFCVALFEALAGHRPFAGETFEALRQAVFEGRPLAPRRPIARRVHRALRRGLARNPADRFASMQELLDALAVQRRGPVITAGAGLAGVAAVALFVLADRAEPEREHDGGESAAKQEPEPAAPGEDVAAGVVAEVGQACADVDEAWAATFSDDISRKFRAAIAEQWPSTAPARLHPRTADAWAGLGEVYGTVLHEQIVQFGEAWRAAYTETCRHADGPESRPAQLLRLCLQGVDWRLTGGVGGASLTLFEDGLVDLRAYLSRCTEALVAPLPLPEGERGTKITEARVLVDQSAVERWSDRGDKAKTYAVYAVKRADKLAEPAVMAEAYLEWGLVLAGVGETPRALEALRAAAEHAKRAEHLRVLRETVDALAWTSLWLAEDPDEARRWLDVATELDAQVAPSSAERARRKIVEGRLELLAGRSDAALAAFAAASSLELRASDAVALVEQLGAWRRRFGADARTDPIVTNVSNTFEKGFRPHVLDAIGALSDGD